MENERKQEIAPEPTNADPGAKAADAAREGADWARSKLEATLMRVVRVQLLELEELAAQLRDWRPW